MTELYFASGTSTVRSNGVYRVAKEFDGRITINGDITHSWWDPYDWHAGLVAPIPGFGLVEDNEALCLIAAKRAAEYQMTSGWAQTVQSNFISPSKQSINVVRK